MFKKYRVLLVILVVLGYVTTVYSQELPAVITPPPISLIDTSLIKKIKSYLATEIVILSVKNQNLKYQHIKEKEVTALDAQWVEERKRAQQPLIAATLSNPLSAYLTRLQAHSDGVFNEIIVMDNKGLNVGQSNITSDYWQGDEAKWQKTYAKGAGAIFIDEPEWDKETSTWRAQVNMSIDDPANGTAIGAATFEINLTELLRRR